MADLIVCPPADRCPCTFCAKRRRELNLAKRLEAEWYGDRETELTRAALRDMGLAESIVHKMSPEEVDVWYAT